MNEDVSTNTMFNLFTTTAFVFRQGRGRGRRYGISQGQRTRGKAKDSLRRVPNFFSSILKRLFEDETYRASQTAIGWTEEIARHVDELAPQDSTCHPTTPRGQKEMGKVNIGSSHAIQIVPHSLERILIIQTVVQPVKSEIDSQFPILPHLLEYVLRHQQQRQQQQSCQAWWISDEWNSGFSWSQHQWRQWHDSSH